MKTKTLASLAIALCTTVSAQRTWVVDENGGPGHNYRTVDAAYQAAAGGDRILIRTGSYTLPGFIDKGVTFEGIGDPTLVERPTPTKVTTLRSGSALVFRDLSVFAVGYLLEMRDVQHVLFDKVRFRDTQDLSGIDADRCPIIVLRNVEAFVYFKAKRSRIFVEGGSYRSAIWFGRAHPSFFIQDTEISVTNAMVSGSPAIYSIRGRIIVRGKSVLRSQHASWGNVIDGLQTEVFLDPASNLIPVGQGKAVVRAGRVVRRSLSTLDAPGTPVTGQSFSYSLTGQPGDNYAILLNTPANNPTGFEQEPILISLTAPVYLHAGVVPSTGSQSFSRVIPSVVGLNFVLLGMQGATWGPGRFDITNLVQLSPR